MQLILRVVRYMGQAPDEDRAKTFGTEGGTIGRSTLNDWVLPDPSRFLSSRHAWVRFEAGKFYLTDTSTNGVFVNQAATPVGMNREIALRDGDTLVMGEYELTAAVIDEHQSAREANVTTVRYASSQATILNPAQRGSTDVEVPTPQAPATGMLDEVFEQMQRTGTPRIPASESAREPAEFELAYDLGAAFADTMGRPNATVDNKGLLDAFLRGANLTADSLTGTAPEALLEQAGKVLNQLATNMRALSVARASFQNTLGIPPDPHAEQARLFAADNTLAVLQQLLAGSAARNAAAADAVDDIIVHELALLAGLRAGFATLLQALDPNALQELFAGEAEATLWTHYCERYELLKAEAESDFHSRFGKAFAEAYAAERAAQFSRHDS